MTEKTEDFNLAKALRPWRKERNIKNITRGTYVKQVLEELLELYGLPKEKIDKDTEAIYNNWFADIESNEVTIDVLLDGAEDIIVFSDNFIEDKGYDSNKVANEVFKEISCRKQDPKQEEEWDLYGVSGKWQKWREQPKEELYKADFSSCLLEDG